MSTDKSFNRLYRARRRYKERVLGLPWYRRLGRKLEEYNKRLTIALVGRLMNIRPAQAPLDPMKLSSILIIRHDAIGDMLLTSPVWRSLKRQYPHITIGVVASFRNRSLLEHDPDVDFVYQCNGSTLKEVWRTARETRKQRWSLVLPTIYNRKTKMAVMSRILAPSAPASMVLLPNDSPDRYRHLFSIVVHSPWATNEVQMIERTRFHLEHTVAIDVSDSEWRPSVVLDPVAMNAAAEELIRLAKHEGNSKWIHVHLEAKNEFKEFGLENSLQLSRQLLEQLADHSIFWTCSPQSYAAVEAFLSQAKVPRLHLFPTNSIAALAAVVDGASVVVTPDTSVVHLASALGRPVVGLYHIVHEWLPWMVPNIVLTPPQMGEPVKNISVTDAVNSVLRLLAENNVAVPSRPTL